MEFRISTPDSEQIPDLVRSGALDIAFYPEQKHPVTSALEVHPFVEDNLVLVSGKESVSTLPKTMAFSSLIGIPFVDLVPERALRKLVDQTFELEGLHRETRYEVSEVESLLEFVERGLGVAVVPFHLAHAAAQSPRFKVSALKPSKGPLPAWTIVLLTYQNHRKKLLGAPLPYFLELLESTYGKT